VNEDDLQPTKNKEEREREREREREEKIERLADIERVTEHVQPKHRDEKGALK
jgi:hypothetical protein